MNHTSGFESMVKVTLIVTLSAAIVFFSGCRKKQPDKSVKTPTVTISNNQKSSEHDAPPQTQPPDVEANDQNFQIAEANDQNAVDLPDETKQETVIVPDTNTSTKKMITAVPQPQTQTAVNATYEPATTASTDQLEEMASSEPFDLNSFAEMNDTKTKVDFISKVAGRSPELLSNLVDKALEDKDPGVRSAAIEELAQKGLDTPDSIPAIERALNDPDPLIRQKGIDACANITDPAVTGVFQMGLNDESEDVRAAAVRLSAEKGLLSVLESGMTSRYADVKTGAANELENIPSEDAVPILLPGLNDPDPEFQKRIKEILKSQTGQEFGTYDQGKAWWDANPGNSTKDPNQN